MKRVVILDDETEAEELVAASAMPGIARTRRSFSMLEAFPLLALSLFLFAALNLTSDGTARPWFRSEAFAIHQMSGDIWRISAGDVFLAFSMFLLYIEILRATRNHGEAVINHAFSAVVFVGALALFLTRPGFGNSVFFIYLSMTALDFLAGFIITAIAARRDTRMGGL